jgi:hypothetical protein
VKMNPTLAEKILNNNTLNRPLRQGRVERYARDMAAGDWRSNGETIKMTADGDLLDGQHRLFAVIESKATVEMLVVEGLSRDVMPTIDTGAPRAFSDVLAIDHGKYTMSSAAILRWLYWYQQKPRPATISGQRATHSELYALLAANPDVPDRAGEVGTTKMARRIVQQSALAFVYTLAYRADAGKAGAWLAMIDKGEGMDAKHPVLQLRDRMLANKLATAKLPPLDVCALIVKSWNQYITGKRTTNLRWTNQEAFPEVLTTSGR